MLSETMKSYTKRASVLAGSVAAAALMMGVQAEVNTAQALLIDNFGGPANSGAGTGTGTPLDPYVGVGVQNVTDSPGGADTTDSTTSCTGSGSVGGFAWCLGGSRLLTVNAQTKGSHQVTINENTTEFSPARPDGVLRHSPAGVTGTDADAGLTGLRYPTSGTFGSTVGLQKNFLIKEDIQTGDPNSGSPPAGFTSGSTEGTADMMGFIVETFSMDADTTFNVRLDFNRLLDTDGDGSTVGGPSFLLHSFDWNKADFTCDPSCDPNPAPYFFAFTDMLDQFGLIGAAYDNLLASFEEALQNVNAVTFSWGAPTAQNDIVIDSIQTGMRLPEPGTLAIMGMGLVGLGIARRRRKQTA